MPIHTIGDSHAVNGWPSFVTTHHLGPVLCYSIGKDTQCKRCDFGRFGLKNDDTIVLCFGEIDCRCHVHKHIDKSPFSTFQNVIHTLVYDYFKQINRMVVLSKLRFKTICVFNVVPPVRREDKYENAEYPYLGTNAERQAYTLHFNQLLAFYCNLYGYLFFDVYDKYTDNDGFLRDDLSDGNVHIHNGCFLEEFIHKNKLL